jgi:hypothetical protein
MTIADIADIKDADTKGSIPLDRLLRIAVAGTTAVSGYIHAQLYISGYRFIHVIGVMFLLQASASFAIAALLLIGGPLALRVVAAGAAIGALAGFAASRTVGVFGFTERGWQPAPQAMYSVLAETATLLLLTPTLLQVARSLRPLMQRSAD